MDEEDNIPLIQLAERNFELVRTAINIPDQFSDYLNFAKNLLCKSMMSDEEIIEDSQREDNQMTIENEMDADVNLDPNNEEEDRILTKNEIQASLRTLYNGLIQQKSVPITFFNTLNEIGCYLNSNE